MSRYAFGPSPNNLRILARRLRMGRLYSPPIRRGSSCAVTWVRGRESREPCPAIGVAPGRASASRLGAAAFRRADDPSRGFDEGDAVRPGPLRQDAAARVGAGGDREAGAALPRRQAHEHHERRRRRDAPGRPHGEGRALRLQDDAGLHRPGWGDVPGGGRAAGGAHLRGDQYKKPVQPSRRCRSSKLARVPRNVESPAVAGLSRGTERRWSRTNLPMGYIGSPVLKTGWATGPGPLRSEP